MDINKMKVLSYDELRALYKNFLYRQNISKATINTAYINTFYLWKKEARTCSGMQLRILTLKMWQRTS